MTLDEMCVAAARYSDRDDEFEKNEDGEYEDDALLYFNIFKDAINEAYFAVARECAMPDRYERAVVDADGLVDLRELSPEIYGIKDVLDEHRTMNLSYTFDTKFLIRVYDTVPGNNVTIYYHYVPDRLEELDDTPIFPESIVDPMVYICLAVARIWMSEKKFDYANQWLRDYHSLLAKIKNGLHSRANRRIPRRMFR